jgi:meiotically up-regulated gene 157 (Mug157) protein
LKLDSYIETFKANLAQQEATVSKEVETIALNARGLGETIRKAIYEHAIVTHPTFGQVFAFEVDCYGSTLIMDDANTPSLLSLPVLGFVEKNDTIYRNTRDLILSEWNPWFFKSKFARGIGGPHTGQNMVWPMSIIMQIQTSESESEVRECIDMLKRMAKRTGSLMCESFNVNRPSSFTRPWFAWANGLAGTAILDIVEKYPHLA